MKSPAFQFYPSEFLADENVAMMSNREVGCYIKLLCYCWREGSIPSEIEKIAKLCGEDSSAMAQLWLSLSSCFSSAITSHGSAIDSHPRLINKRLEIERKKQEEHRKERSESGSRGAKSRWSKELSNHGSAIAQPMAQPMANDGSASSTAVVTDKEKEKVVKKEKEKVDGSDDAWLESLQASEPYQRINVRMEHRKAEIWCQSNRRLCSRRFFLNWLNKVCPVQVSASQKASPSLQIPPIQKQSPGELSPREMEELKLK
jgi:uncharacterized protein YdaU (DUF1376 family)